MRQQRRTSFAAPFVMVVAAACGGGKHEPIHMNPPPPQIDAGAGAMSADECKKLDPSAACEAGQSCHTGDECGLQGYECHDSKWAPMMMACNPPPPKS